MTTSPESLFPPGDDLDSGQLHMEPDEMDTLKEGEDPGTQWGRLPQRGLQLHGKVYTRALTFFSPS